MLNQNVKGFVTLFLIAALLVALYAGYKTVIEPRFINNSSEIFVTETDSTLVSPEIEINSSTAKIFWETPYQSTGSVLFSNNKQDCVEKNNNCISLKSAGTTEHEVSLTELTPNTEYFYKIEIDDTTYPINESEFFTFTTQQAQLVEQNTDLGGGKTLEDFKLAIQEQNMEFDLNKDGKVSVADIAEFKKQQN